MLTLTPESENVAVSTSPLPLPLPRPKLQPVAGMAATVTPIPGSAGSPLPQPRNPAQPEAPPPNLQTTVFTGEARQQSPWTGGVVRVAPKQPVPQPMAFGKPAALPEMEDGIDGVRKLLFGRQMNEVQTKVAELQLSLNGEMKRLREALMSRVDEMAGYLHRDMVVLRDEMQREMAQIKADLFTAATGLSSVKDRLISVEGKTNDDAAAALVELDARIVRQESAVSAALDHMEAKLGRTIESKCAEALSVLAKKSEIADLLAQVGTLVEKQSPGVELGWFSAAPAGPTAPAPAAVAAPASVPHAAGSGTWAALAKGESVDPCASDWSQPGSAFMPGDSLIA